MAAKKKAARKTTKPGITAAQRTEAVALAKVAGCTAWGVDYDQPFQDFLVRFAAIVRHEERHRIAEGLMDVRESAETWGERETVEKCILKIG